MRCTRLLSLLVVVMTWLVLGVTFVENEASAGLGGDAGRYFEEGAFEDPVSPDASLDDATSSAYGDDADASDGACPADMVEVLGRYCPDLPQRCLRWLSSEQGGGARCALFAPSGPCKTATSKKHFCVDRYEYPNRRGARPTVMKTWVEAQEACRARGKRLCTDSEWTLACEGPPRFAYPYGNQRSASACNIDKRIPPVDQKALADPKRSAAEVARLWQGEMSGSRPECKSPYGVFDMTGNVDEWVVNENGKGHRSGSKGGYWGPVRARCRPMTTAHGETFPFYQTGFRCCADPDVARTEGKASFGAEEERAAFP